jgi:hypothetical protein
VICAGFVDTCLPLLYSYRFIPSLIPDVRNAWGGCGWHKHLPKLRLGIHDIIRDISTYFVVISETPNTKYTRNHSETRIENIDDTIDPYP